jgi:hypothetical protein
MLQPGAALGWANLEPRVRLPQTQPPPVPGFLFITAQELNEKRRKLLSGASEGLAWEEWAKDRVFANACVEFRRYPLAACFTA